MKAKSSPLREDVGIHPADDGDGNDMRVAINLYAGWKMNPNGKSLEDIRQSMVAAFNNPQPTYDLEHKRQLASRIIECYNAQPRVVTTDQETLSFLGIRKQCLEWCNAVSLASGGGTRNYFASSVSAPAQYRAGMGFFKSDKSHAALIIDIEWNSRGQPMKFKLAEANYSPDEWSNPDGQIPWKRTVFCGRQTQITGYRVVKFD